MSDLPPDIIPDILSRLPAKCLLRFRCVSKPWRSLIDGPDFIKLHLSRSIGDDSSLSLIDHDEGTLYSINIDSLDSVVKINPEIPNFEDYHLRCSCYGFLLFENGKSDTVALFNPMTRKHLILPDPHPLQSRASAVPTNTVYVFHCLGHDSLNDDYKVLRVLEIRNDQDDTWISSEALIFSLKLNLWRRVKNFWSGISIPYKQTWSAQVNGAFHTVLLQNIEGNRSIAIVAFDVYAEALQLFDLPKYVTKQLFGVTTDVFGRCLCAIVAYAINRTEVWMMKEYGAKESWIKLLSIEFERIEPFVDVRPIVYSKNRCKVLIYVEDKGLVWYDLREKTMKNVCISGVPPLFGAETYVGSLVLLNGCHDLDEIKKQHGQEKLKKVKKKNR